MGDIGRIPMGAEPTGRAPGAVACGERGSAPGFVGSMLVTAFTRIGVIVATPDASTVTLAANPEPPVT